MSAKLFVGNLSFQVSANDLEDLFKGYGSVKSAQVITDRDTGRSKGFGFVEMSDANEASAAMQALNGRDLMGRGLTVNEAKPREDHGGNRTYGGGGNRRY